MRPRSLALAVLAFLLALSGFTLPLRPALGQSGAAPPLQQDALTWEKLSAGLESPFALWLHPDFAANRQLWAAQEHTLQDVGFGYGRLYRSTDGGTTWQARSPLGSRILLAAYAATGPGDPTIFALEAAVDANSLPVYNLLRSTTGGVSWQTVWPNAPRLTAIHPSPAFAVDKTVFALLADPDNGGLWRSTDGGITWNPGARIVPFAGNCGIAGFAFAPDYATSGVILAAVPAAGDSGSTYPSQVARSSDRGQTWQCAGDGCANSLRKLAWSHGATVYALGGNGEFLYRSTDAGATWQPLPAAPGAAPILDFALSPHFAADATILLATAQGMAHSTDGGASWQMIAWQGAPVWRVWLSPHFAVDRTIAVALRDVEGSEGHPAGTFLSQDGGATWRPAGIARVPVRTLALSPAFATDNRLWAASGDGAWAAYRSADAGATWQRQAGWNMNGWGGFTALAATPYGALYGTTPFPSLQGGIYRSADFGASFAPIAGSPQFAAALAWAEADDGAQSLWAGNYAGLFRSLDEGAWQNRSGDLPAGRVLSVAAAPGAASATTSRVYAVIDGAQAGLYRTQDGGATWARVPILTDGTLAHVTLAPDFATGPTLWASTAAHGVLRSSDGGATWQKPDTNLAGCGPVSATGEGGSRSLWAACGGALYTSADGGVTWSAAGPAGADVQVVATSPLLRTIYVGGTGGVWRARPAGSVVRVVDLQGAPVAGADVYRNGARLGTTGADGVLLAPLRAGDRLVARQLIATQPSTRAYHNPDGGAPWSYRVYRTSLIIPATGEPAPQRVDDPAALQTLILRPGATLIGFNLVAAVEFDATPAYLEELRAGLALASRALYDASNGQMLFESVTIYDGGAAMAHADLQVRADWTLRPHAKVDGIRFDQSNLSFAYFATAPHYPPGYAWSHPWAANTLVHEFGHYGLRLLDSYLRLAGITRVEPASCTGPEIRSNGLPDRNATLMDYHYTASEFAMRGVAGAWADPCLRTQQFEETGRSDWEQIASGFAGAGWALRTPADYGQVVEGPHAIPVAAWSRAVIASDAQGSLCATPPQVQVQAPEGFHLTTSQVFLERGSRLIDEGPVGRDGLITLWGAGPGDRALFEVQGALLGAAQSHSPLWGEIYQAAHTVTCATAVQAAAEITPVVLEPAPFDLSLAVEPEAGALAVTVRAGTPLADAPALRWMQNGASAAVAVPLQAQAGGTLWTGTVTPAAGLPPEGLLRVEAHDAQGRAAVAATPVRLEQAAPAAGQTIYAAGGGASLLLRAGTLQGSGGLLLQEERLPASPPAGLDLVAGPFALRLSPALQPADDAAAASLSLHYTGMGTGGALPQPASLRVYGWQQGAWQPLESVLLEAGQRVAAVVPAGGGLYALFGRWETRVLLPLVQR